MQKTFVTAPQLCAFVPFIGRPIRTAAVQCHLILRSGIGRQRTFSSTWNWAILF